MGGSFDGQRALGHCEFLSGTIGARVMGTSSEASAAGYVRTYFDELGLLTTEETFEVEAATVTAYGLEILEPHIGEIQCFPVLLTPGTAESGLTGHVVLAEGCQAPSVGPRLAGKIVLWAVRSRMEFLTGYRELVRHRPAAIVLAWPALGVEPKRLLICESMSRPYLRVPTFCITFEDALALVQHGARRARVQLLGESGRATSRNIIGELRGRGASDEVIVIGGHIDTMPGVPGATDNASGVAMVMELARLYAARGSRRTLRFVAWGSEEGGLLGSLGYVCRQGTSELEKHLLCISLDGLGFPLGENVCYLQAAPELGESIIALSKEADVPLQVHTGFYGSDGEAFARGGIPTVSFGRVGPLMACVHTPGDSLDLVATAQMDQIGNLVDTFLQRCNEAVTWPFEKRVPSLLVQQVDEILQRIGWVEN